MKRSFRLRKNDEFQRVYRRGIPAYARDFKIIGFRNHLGHNRYGFSLSKKFGKAHERNRTKRRLREIVRAHEQTFPQSFDYVILPKPSAKTCTFQQLEQSLLHCLAQWKKRMETKTKRSETPTQRNMPSSQTKAENNTTESTANAAFHAVADSVVKESHLL